MGGSGKQMNDSTQGSLDIKEEPQTPSMPHHTMSHKDDSSNDVKSESSFDFKEEIKQEEPDLPKFEAKWEELPEKVLAHVFAYCVV